MHYLNTYITITMCTICSFFSQKNQFVLSEVQKEASARGVDADKKEEVLSNVYS